MTLVYIQGRIYSNDRGLRTFITLLVSFNSIYRGVEESGCPRWSHKPEIVGSNPTPASKLATARRQITVVASRWNPSWVCQRL